MKKKVFSTELAYVLALIIMAFSAAFAEKANLGMSMVVAPAYTLHLKLVEYLPWFSFGVAEYFLQGLIVIITALIVKRFKLSYLFSFVTALLYGTLLDIAIEVVAPLPANTLLLRIIWFTISTAICSFAVSLFFHTYISPEAYELIVKEISAKFRFNINKVKTAYDCISTIISIILSFTFFGFGVFKGVHIGTFICSVINGFLISRFTKLLERFFTFENKLNLQKYFE